MKIRPIALLAFQALCGAQVITNAPEKFVLDGKVDEWAQEPVFASDAQKAWKVWARHNDKGLVIAGLVSRPLGPDTHVELWLTAVHDLKLPPIGWGDQFGEEAGTPENCAERVKEKGRPKDLAPCLAWVRSQPAYRVNFQKLFIRKWRIAPDATEENYATPAFNLLTAAQAKKLGPVLKPAGDLTSRFAQTSEEFSFEIAVPWSAFPPG